MISRRALLLGGLGLGAASAAGALTLWPRGIEKTAATISRLGDLVPELPAPVPVAPQRIAAEPWAEKLVEAALGQIGITLLYDADYERIAYPMGDVDAFRGVCTDVVIRAYRAGLDIDLQKLVHEDMRRNFALYPKIWGLAGPDSNIDHRRVPNLATFFRRKGEELAVTDNGADYQPGDIVTQAVGGRPHIVVISNLQNAGVDRPLIVHNIGWGTELADGLFDYPITGRYRYRPA